MLNTHQIGHITLLRWRKWLNMYHYKSFSCYIPVHVVVCAFVPCYIATLLIVCVCKRECLLSLHAKIIEFVFFITRLNYSKNHCFAQEFTALNLFILILKCNGIDCPCRLKINTMKMKWKVKYRECVITKLT